MSEIINKVAKSKLITIDLEDYYDHSEKVTYDLANQLYRGLVLREKDFREHVKEHDWEGYIGKHVAITCSSDAIIPTWAYMLVAASLVPFAKSVYHGSILELEKELLYLSLIHI